MNNECTKCNGNPCDKKSKAFPSAVIEIDNPPVITNIRKVTIPASMGDDATVPPVVGKYHNVLLYYEANSKTYLYSSDGIPTQLVNGVTDYEAAVNLPQINGNTLIGDKAGEELGLQDKLAAGDNITIENNIISATDTTYGPATEDTIGLVKPGDGLEVDANGTMSISDVEQYAHFFDTVADMKAATNLQVGDYARTGGFYTLNDGGGALYKIVSSATADGQFMHPLDNGMFAMLLNSDHFNILQIGAKRNDDTFDNANYLQTVFKDGRNDSVVTFPSGTYYTTTVNYVGNNQPTNNLKVYGNNATIKLSHPNAVATLLGTYTGEFDVARGIDEINFGTSCTVNTIKLEDGNIFFYLAISDKTLIPASLVADMVLRGAVSGLEAYIASIDTSDPDGTDTARIYLYSAHNEKNKALTFKLNNGVLNERLIVKRYLGDNHLYIKFNNNTIPSYMTVNTQLKQGDKTARISNVSISYNGINFVELNCMPEPEIFSAESLYLESNIEFSVYSYTGYSAGILSFNRYTNCLIDGLIFDGGNLDISRYEGNTNNWNSVITGDCKNLTVQNCKFINSIMGGIQIGGIGNAFSSATHNYPENVNVLNCYFYNNGRGDIEVIYGRHINIENCNGSGNLDVEANSSEILDNITINNCNFNMVTPYAPATTSAGISVKITNSIFNTILCQQKINLYLCNCSCHYFQPYACSINAVNCKFDLINGYHGNECMSINNSSLYNLYTVNPASQFGNERIYIHNCILDFSLADPTKTGLNRKTININSSTLISSTRRFRIDDNRSIMNFENVILKNVFFRGAGSSNTDITSTFDGCKFLMVDNTVASTSSDVSFAGGSHPILFKNCYFETQIQNTGLIRLVDCVVNETTKPYFASTLGVTANGLRTRDGSGISWNWLGTPTASHNVSFRNIEFSPAISQSTLGVKAYSTPVSTTSVADGCTGYFVGSTTHALVQMYHNSGALAVRYVDYI